MATLGAAGHAAVLKLASDLAEPDRDRWLAIIKACWQLTRRVGPARFAKKWLGEEFVDARFSLRKLNSYAILERDGELVRGGHRAYWRMPDPDGVERALNELGYL